MKKEEMTIVDIILEAVSAAAVLISLGLQIYYGVSYSIHVFTMIMNIAALLLIYAGLTLFCIYPEHVNGLSKEVCSGKIRRYTIQMVRLIKFIFVLGILFTAICDVMGQQINSGYSIIVVVLIVLTALYYEKKIIHILRKKK